MPDWLSRYAERPAAAPTGDWLSTYADAPVEEGPWSKAWSWATKGLADPLAKKVGDWLTAPHLNDSVLASQVRGFAAGALQGASDALTSPIGIASNLLTGGAATAARFGLPAVARGAALANAALGAPALAHGLGSTFEAAQEGDLGGIGQGALETGVGALGVLAPFLHAPQVAPRELVPSGTPPPVKLGLPTPYDPTAVTPSNARARQADYLARSGRTLPAQGVMPPQTNRMNAPLRDADPAGLMAALAGPEPLDVWGIEPAVPLQNWTPSGIDVATNPRRMNEPPPQRSATRLLDEHLFPNGRRTVPEQNVLPAAPWLDPDMAPTQAPRRDSTLAVLDELLSPSAGESSYSGTPQQMTLPGSLEPASGLDKIANLPLEEWGALDRESNRRFVERLMAPFLEPLPPEPPRFRAEPPAAGDVVTPPVPATDFGLPAPSDARTDPDTIASLFSYGPSRTLESLTTPGMEPFISPEIEEILRGQPGGMDRPLEDLLGSARDAAKRWVSPSERDLPWRERLDRRANDERYQYVINEPDRPASLGALERMSQPESLADRLERELRDRARRWEDFTSEEKAAVYEGRTQRHMREAEEARAQEAAAQAALEASLPKRFSDATPEEQRELRRMLEELRSFPFVKRSFNFDIPGQGGSADVVAGAGGAPIFHDIMGGRSGSRNAAIRALEAYVEGGKPATAISRRAAHVARRAADGDPSLRRRMLPPDAGDVPPPPDPDVDFPFGENDPTGESGFISIDPAQWKKVAQKTGKSLEALRFFSMLSGPLTHAKNIAGNLGAVALESARRGIRGDFDTAGRILGETFNPEWVRDLRAGFNHPESSVWTPETADRPRTGIMSWPSRAAEAPDYATRQALRRAGLTDEEARHVTYTGEPRSQAGQAFVGGVRRAGTVGRLISPFPRIATNLLEVGLEHTPVLGSIAETVSDGRLKSGWDKQSLGALAALAGATFGGFTDPRVQAVFQAALGPVNLPYSAGMAVAKGMDEGDTLPDIGKSVWNRYAEATPIPQYLAGPSDWLAQHVPTAFQQLGLTDPKLVAPEAGDLWPFGKAISKLPGGDRILSSRPASQSNWLEQYGDR